MNHNKRKFKWDDFIANILLVVSFVFVLIVGLSFYQSVKTGEDPTFFGYRSIMVLTGSMEPTMMTNSIAITKEVETLDDIQVGDIVTYHITDEEGITLRITHRIHEIGQDGNIYTKGDNNSTVDRYVLTIENIDSKVIYIMNWVAAIIAILQTPNGQFYAFCMLTSFCLMCFAYKFWFSKEKDEADLEKESGSLNE